MLVWGSILTQADMNQTEIYYAFVVKKHIMLEAEEPTVDCCVVDDIICICKSKQTYEANFTCCNIIA